MTRSTFLAPRRGATRTLNTVRKPLAVIVLSFLPLSVKVTRATPRPVTRAVNGLDTQLDGPLSRAPGVFSRAGALPRVGAGGGGGGGGGGAGAGGGAGH